MPPCLRVLRRTCRYNPMLHTYSALDCGHQLANHLSSRSQLESSTVSAMKAWSDDICQATANGQVSAEGELDAHFLELGLDARLLVLKSCPCVFPSDGLWKTTALDSTECLVVRMRGEELLFHNFGVVGLRFFKKAIR